MGCREWKKVRFGEACYINKNTYSKSDNWAFVNYLDTGNITENRIDSIQYFDTAKEKLPSRAKRKVSSNDIIFSTVRPNQKHYGIIKKPVKNMLVSTGFAVITAKPSLADSRFLYYYLTQEHIVNFLHMIGEHSTSAYPSIKPSDIEGLEIMLPTLIEQKFIAKTLSCLDEKIELNNRINKILEEIAQAVFKSWFVDFEPFQDGEFEDSGLGRIPKGWHGGVLSDLITVKYGKDHKKLAEGSIPVYGSGGIMRYVNKPLCTSESVLIPRKGTLNNIMYVNEPFWSVDTMFFSEMKYPNCAKYVYFLLKNKDLQLMNTGSAVPSMTTEILNSLPVIIPPNEVIRQFDETVTSMFFHMQANYKENTVLSKLRDTLLPKLISGKIRVPIEEV
ncbi:MAG: restriction endonuclease subunit S [Clostridia bacterium]|jgi:type I restriction enzyme S subunit|nr:restriction endonuclease subunit S [Clostridia bacterium]